MDCIKVVTKKAAAVFIMGYFHRYHVIVLLAVWVTTEPTLSHETLVLSLHHNPHVFRVNTKEFLIVGNSNVSISCGISIPQESEYQVEISLRNGDGVVAEVVSGKETYLYWTGSSSAISNLSCRVNFTVRGQSSTIEMNGVITHSVSNDVHCFPGFHDSAFLMGELAQIFCVVTRDDHGRDNSRSRDWDFQNDQKVIFSGGFRVVVNYVKLDSEEGVGPRCPHGNRETCPIENFRLERNLTIVILPSTFSEDISEGFRCETNLPTEYISWYIEIFGNDNMMQLEPWSEIPWQYSITHNRNTSELFFTDSNVTGVKSVLCSTNRAGYFVQAMTNNETSDTNNEENHHATSMLESRSSTGLVAIVIILSLVCITLCAVTFLLTYNIKRLKQKYSNVQSNVCTTAVTPPKATEDPYYYATSTESGNNTNGEEKSAQDTTNKTLKKYTEGLSTDILDYGAVVVENSAYEAT